MQQNHSLFDRRDFLKIAGYGVGAGLIGLQSSCKRADVKKDTPDIQGFSEVDSEDDGIPWEPKSDRKIRVGLIGYGVCRFSAEFSFQHHPNVEVAAVSDLIPERCAKLAEVTGCKKTYPSLEELVKDDSIDAVFIATDAPSHARHVIEALNHGKHVACAVPAVFGSLEDAHRLYEAVKKSGLKYMMFETSMYRKNLYAMRTLYEAGCLGKILYAEGEYWHYSKEGIDSYKDWRMGMPEQWYPTHSDAYYVGVTNGSFLEVSCLGIPSDMERYHHNAYNNPFGTEISLYRTSDGGIARMGRTSDTQGEGYGSETGRVRGTKGSYYDKYQGIEQVLPDLRRPSLPPGVEAGGHGGSHGRLTDEFVSSILEDRKPLVDIAMALNMTVGGIVAHQSAMRGGEWLKIPQFKY